MLLKGLKSKDHYILDLKIPLSLNWFREIDAFNQIVLNIWAMNSSKILNLIKIYFLKYLIFWADFETNN